MTFRIGEIYNFKTGVHNFTDIITVIDIQKINGSKFIVVKRNNGTIYYLSEQEIQGADYYLVSSFENDNAEGNDNLTEAMTEFGDEDYYLEQDEIFIEHL